MSFTKGRFLITLGISIGIWVISGLVQTIFNTGSYGSYIFSTSCEITGYPVALCISSNQKVIVIVTYFVNILFWFVVVNLFWKFFRR